MNTYLKFMFALLILLGSRPSYALDPIADLIASCAGKVIANGTLEYLANDDSSVMNDAFAFGRVAVQSQIQRRNLDSQTAAAMEERLWTNYNALLETYTSGSWDASTYEDLLNCYRRLGNWHQIYNRDSNSGVWEMSAHREAAELRSSIK